MDFMNDFLDNSTWSIMGVAVAIGFGTTERGFF